MTEPAATMPSDVAAAYDAMPKAARQVVLAARALIFETAQQVDAGPVTETLKWGEPAYLTEASKSGTTIRLGVTAGHPAAFFNCNTTLVDGFRSDFPEVFEYVGNRAVILNAAADQAALGVCLARALTYHRAKRRKKGLS